MNRPFDGAKLALFVGDRLAVILRDDRPDIPWPGYWDLPGGGREGEETPLACALRETREELGLGIDPSAVGWGKCFAVDGRDRWFFAVHLPAEVSAQIRLGSEGQRWALMQPSAFLEHRKAVPSLKERLRIYLADVPGDIINRA